MKTRIVSRTTCPSQFVSFINVSKLNFLSNICVFVLHTVFKQLPFPLLMSVLSKIKITSGDYYKRGINLNGRGIICIVHWNVRGLPLYKRISKSPTRFSRARKCQEIIHNYNIALNLCRTMRNLNKISELLLL